ncbi:hypothetical protein PsorP6_005737 [Peronosclerospora sorghi]|uniref:Uncharacterized protein n=1 Tax=Peronosclerospora sorghi TaxID=230839 RepID=A0ACC0W5M7_9STRA|nr:hypothetical protein PsorP6_005737 [Peronosclerospora sorghi]
MTDEEDLSSEQPLLDPPVHDVASKKKEKNDRPWYRRRVVTIASAVVLLVGLPFLVVSTQVSRLASKAIQETTMQIRSMDLSRPTSNAVTLHLHLRLIAPSPFPATVEAATFRISYKDVAVGHFKAPRMDIRHGVNDQFVSNATLEIQDKEAWDAFARDMMRRPHVECQIRSVLTIHVRLLGGLVTLQASDIPLDKTMRFHGMDGLGEMHVAQVDMTNSTLTHVRATIKTCVRNPSITTIRPVGALCLHAHYPDLGEETLVAHLKTSVDTALPIAHGEPSHAYCASLGGTTDMSTGYNLLELQGEMVGVNAEAISALISKYLSNVSAALMVVTCDHQATSVDLYNQAMKNLTIQTFLPPQRQPLVESMYFRNITLRAPLDGRANEMIQLETAVLVEATSPLGPVSALTITDVNMSVRLFAADTALGVLSTESVEVIHGEVIGRSNISVKCLTELHFVDKGEAFGRFVRASVVDEKVSLTLTGSMGLICEGALGVLKLSGLPLHTTVLLNGMNNFQHVRVENFSLPGTNSTAKDEEPIQAQIEVRNPSVFTASIGALTMDLSLDSPREKFGVLYGVMNLAPGKNSLELNGNLKPKTDDSGRVSDAVAGFFSSYLNGKSSHVCVTITQTQYTNCVWMHEAFAGLIISTSFPGAEKGFQMISRIKLNQLDVILEETLSGERQPRTNTRMLVRTDMTAKVTMPHAIGIPVQISNVSVALNLENKSGHRLGTLLSAREPCDYNQTSGGAFHLNMHHFYPIGFKSHDDVNGMAGFIENLLTENTSIVMRFVSDGSTNQGAFPVVHTRMGTLLLRNIPVRGEPLIPAMDSFRYPPVKVLSIDIHHGSTHSIVMAMAFSLQNPSIVQTKLGSLELDVFYDGAKMGTATISDFSLRCCRKVSVLRGIFEYKPHPSDRRTAARFLSNFVCGYFTQGAVQKIGIRGSRESTVLDLLQPAMSALLIPSTLPTLSELFPSSPTLVTSSRVYIPSIFHLTRIPTSLELRNPFSERITVTRVDLELYPCKDQSVDHDGNLLCKKYYDDALAHFAPAAFEPIVIPANTPSCFSCCRGSHCEEHMTLCPHASRVECMSADVPGLLSPEAIATIVHALTGGLLMRVNGTIQASIGDYATHLFYRQDSLLVTLAR